MKFSDIGKPNAKEFEFVDPYTDEPTGIFVTVHSINSKIGKNATIEMHRKVIQLKDNVDNIDENGNIKKELQDITTKELVASLIETWRGAIGDNNKEIKPSKEAYMQAFSDSTEFLDAVFMFANELGNFGIKKGKVL